jgi:hypothetical protein
MGMGKLAKYFPAPSWIPGVIQQKTPKSQMKEDYAKFGIKRFRKVPEGSRHRFQMAQEERRESRASQVLCMEGAKTSSSQKTQLCHSTSASAMSLSPSQGQFHSLRRLLSLN